MTQEKNFLKKVDKGVVLAYVQIVVGCVIGGAAYPLFLVPGQIAPGGLSGVAMILNHLLGTPVGLMSIVLNIPLFLVGYKTLGTRFVFRTLLGTLLFSVCIDALKLPPVTQEPLLNTIFGGALLGVGLGMIMRGGATTGGTDMMARMLHKHVKFISVGMVLLAMDGIVVLVAAFTFGMTEGLYALICIFVSSKVLDVVMLGLSNNKACFIISDAWEKITQRLLMEMERGVTQLSAKGAYSGKERPVVLCVLPPQEVSRMKEIVSHEDERAFIFISDAHEALGEGFSALGGEN